MGVVSKTNGLSTCQCIHFKVSDSQLCSVPKHTTETYRNEKKWTALIEAFGDCVITSHVIVIQITFFINCAALFI